MTSTRRTITGYIRYLASANILTRGIKLWEIQCIAHYILGLRRYSHLLLPRLQCSEFLATAVLLCDQIGHMTRCYHSWSFYGAIIPCKYCYWDRDGDIMLLASCLRTQSHLCYYLASVEWIFSNLNDLRYLCHCEECCTLNDSIMCTVHTIFSFFSRIWESCSRSWSGS